MKMLRKSIGLLLLGATLIAAHGKVSLARGNAGGNGTGLGIQGGIVPGPGSNNVTEVDTTVFRGAYAAGCGYTKGGGVNQIESGTEHVMLLSGKTLPQVTLGGFLYGILHVVVSDGWGPYTAQLDTTGLGTFTHAVNLTVTTQVPGIDGLLPPLKPTVRRWLARAGLVKRTTNVNEDWPFKISIPAGVTCTGTVAGVPNVCIVRFMNDAGAGPFGGCIPIQLVAAAVGPVSADPLSTSVRTTAYNTNYLKPTSVTMMSGNPTATGTKISSATSKVSGTGTATGASATSTTASGALASRDPAGAVFALFVAMMVAVVVPTIF